MKGSHNQRQRRVLAAIPDIFFSAKVTGTARRLGIDARVVGTRHALLKALGDGADMVVIDLDAGALDPIDTIREIRAMPLDPQPRVIGFANHTHESLLQDATAAGCDASCSRGALSASLASMLADG